jgi:ABC-2 type transport system permease protein
VYALAGGALAVGNVLILTLAEDLVLVADTREAIAGLPVVLLLFGIAGAAGEYRHRTAAPAALASGRSRGRLLVARACAYAGAGLAVGAMTVAVTQALGLPLLTSEPGPGIGYGEIASVAAGTIISAALCAMMGVAAGAPVRNQVVGVVGALMLMLVVAPLLNVLNEKVLQYAPFGAAAVLAGDPNAGSLSAGGAALCATTWTVVLLLAAILGASVDFPLAGGPDTTTNSLLALFTARMLATIEARPPATCHPAGVIRVIGVKRLSPRRW